ncbi:STAS domain-containing protein [Streptomyces tropicalis]|uniref:Anti-sigma factor antagonist n=1 Tax=Streptomyces tropicalis TaxID=3034234 RepID=A0ABT6AA48_9ACTN|nr:STAS domain-containing protein [Streptomyces tropicalis]MDF3301519.1 STAS domain-containing protein [Streptomyces tropicalis]
MAETEGAAVPERLLITRTTAGDGICVVTLRGEVDLDGSVHLREALLACLQSADTVVDFGGVTFMDSSGINALITAHRAAVELGARLRIAAPREAVQRVLHLVGVDTLVPCFPTLEQALAG